MTRIAPPPTLLEFGGRRRRRRWPWVVAAVAGAALLVFVLGPHALRAARADVLPGTVLGGVDVGGMDEASLRAALDRLADEREGAPITIALTRPVGEAATHALTARDAGYRIDGEATADAALALGGGLRPVQAWREHLAALTSGTTVPLVESVDERRLRAAALEAAEALGVEPAEGTIEFEGVTPVRIDPVPGVAVDADALADRLRAAVLHGEDRVDAPGAPIEPETTADDVDALEADARRLVSGPVELVRDGGRLVLRPADLAAIAHVVRAEEPPRLRFGIEPSTLAAHLDAAAIRSVERDPVNAEIRLVDGVVEISESQTGFRFSAAAAAEQILTLATTDGPRSSTLAGTVVPPELSTEDARALGVAEPTASFTTHFTPGQSRVQNIARMAELVDGVLLRPGQRLSLNEHVGPRTEEAGFVPGGAILDGEFVEQIGGGVSQFATTMYNAAYFAGFELVQYQAHSYYISRYPMGREATINYPTIDLVVRNSSPHGALIEATTTPSSVTVTIWSTPWVEVESITGTPFNVQPGRVRNGFDVNDVRVLRYPDGRVEQEPRFTRYFPEN